MRVQRLHAQTDAIVRETNDMNFSVRSEIVSIIGLLLLIGAIWAFAYLYTPSEPSKVLDQRAVGDYEGALLTASELQNSPGLSVDEKAIAKINATTVRYTLSGNIQDAIQSIRELKQIAADTNLSLETRAAADYAIANWFTLSGDNLEVYKEIFSGKPYESYLNNCKSCSYRALLKATYKKAPQANAAFLIASSFIKTAFNETDTDRIGRLVAEADRYLKEGRDLVAGGAQIDTSLNGYVSNLYWDAYTTAGLAFFGRTEYKAEYRAKYDALISFLRTNGTVDQKRMLATALWRYGHFVMIIEDDKNLARQMFAQAVTEANASITAQSNSLTALMRYMKAQRAAGHRSTGILNLERAMEISPEFKAYIDSI